MHRQNTYLSRLAVVASIALALIASPGRATRPADTSDSRRIEPAQLTLGNNYSRARDDSRKIIYVSALDRNHLQATVAMLARFADGFRNTLAAEPPNWEITILLPTVEDYAKLSPNRKVRGFYVPARRTLVSVDYGRVLLHEFTHALHHGDAHAAGQQHPVWVCEGLATLFEAADVKDDRLAPHVDLRLRTLQSAIGSKSLISLGRLIGFNDEEFSENAELCYAESRYLMLYLWQQDKLAEWYKLLKADFAKDPSGRKALEKVLGQRLERFEKTWIAWIKDLRLPAGERRSRSARLGLMMRDTAGGVKIIGFVPNSAAELAGRIRIGDYLVAFNGRPVRSTAEAIGAILSAGAKQTVTAKVRRGGRTVTVRQPLGAPKSR